MKKSHNIPLNIYFSVLQAMIRYRSPIYKILEVVAYAPLLLTGYSEEKQLLKVTLLEDFTDNSVSQADITGPLISCIILTFYITVGQITLIRSRPLPLGVLMLILSLQISIMGFKNDTFTNTVNEGNDSYSKTLYMASQKKCPIKQRFF